jgi:hypothetical protein
MRLAPPHDFPFGINDASRVLTDSFPLSSFEYVEDFQFNFAIAFRNSFAVAAETALCRSYAEPPPK